MNDKYSASGRELSDETAAYFAFNSPMATKISSLLGNRPVSFLEKIFLPSTTTSKTPPPDLINPGLTPYRSFSASAKLAA
jgi:hypothetical protein